MLFVSQTVCNKKILLSGSFPLNAVVLQEQKGLRQGFRPLCCTPSPEDFTWGWFWTEDTRVLFAVEGKKCRAATRKTLPYLVSCCLQGILVKAERADATEVHDFPMSPETGSMGAGREPACEGSSKALQNRMEIQTYIQKPTSWRGKTLPYFQFIIPW